MADAIFRLRLNNCDHYQSQPTSLDPPIWGPGPLTPSQRGNMPQIPIIRVFGATETGQKVCAHIHGAFPYLYIPYTGSIDRDDVDRYMATFRNSIDHALALSYRRNPYDNPRNSTFVAHISLSKGVPFFGYNVGYKYFLKISLLNPLHMTRFTDLLQQGAILKQTFQPYEAHLQYLLQWMCDFNLYGCAYLEARSPRFRIPVPALDDLDDPEHLWHDESISPESMLDMEKFPRQSHCQLELDIRVEDILNRHSIKARPLHHSFIERLSSLDNLPPEEKLVHSMAGLWKDETRRRRLRMGLSDQSSSPFPPEVLVSMSVDPRNDSKGGWIHEEDFRKAVSELANQERHARGGADLSFESFGEVAAENDGIPTILESVEELFHCTLQKKWRELAKQQGTYDLDELNVLNSSSRNARQTGAAVVDVASIEHTGSDDDYGSDEEVAKIAMLTQRHKLKEACVDDAVGEAKVEGTADRIESRAEQVEKVSLPARTVQDINDGHTKRQAVNGGSQGPFKRPRFDDSKTTSAVSPSRARARNTFMSKSSRDRVQEPDSSRPPAGQIRREQGSQHSAKFAPPPSAQQPTSSQQSSQDIRSAFPSVKNSDESETQTRLSQRDDLAQQPQRSSQTSAKESLAKSTEVSESSNELRTPSAETPSQTQQRKITKLATKYARAFDTPDNHIVCLFGFLPPSLDKVTTTLDPSVIYQDAYYSNEKDVPERQREYAGRGFKLESTTLPFLPHFDKTGAIDMVKAQLLDKAAIKLAEERRSKQCRIKDWQIMQPPPSWDDIDQWLRDEQTGLPNDIDLLDVDAPLPSSQLKRKNRPAPELSQIDGPTQKNKHGFKFTQNKKSTSVQHETGYMSIMALEVHVNSRGDFAPDPEKDCVNMVVWCIEDEQMMEKSKLGVLVLQNLDDDNTAERISRIVGQEVQVEAEDSELDLINRMVDIVREFDPDILTGFEVHNSSWGYLIERARLQYEFNLPDEFSRMKSQSHGRFGKDADRWGFTHTSTMRITGRHTINIWRAMRSELNLLQYTMENVVFHLLHRRIPHYSFATLTRWYQSTLPRDLAKILEYFISRTRLDLEVLDANELIPRTSEQARLLGVDFFSVFSRGSQFKVESLMFRIAKPESFVLVSPSRKQVGAQNALECLPLVMEPQSAFYTSPMLVLDFQSLYPSVMIAYNYCYSTCLGRIVNWRGTNKLGFADFERAPGLLELVQDKLNIAPNGMMYVKPEMRKSLLAKMLGEILETRVMVKSGMKVDKDDKTLQQLLNNRQLALKLIANVTYGYTSASFSGRMPCSEIADSIVQTGRETLEKAIALIHSVERWGAEVVYGDTDSLFVYLKGRTRAEAFKIGDEMAKVITDMNPRPVKLKFEKVYHPCVLLAKKRYVGFKYESPAQTEPEFDAKGIETVRRDGTPAEQKIEEKALKLLFRTSDLSAVKQYFQAQCAKIMTGRVSIQDFCFAKEVKLGTYADKGPPPPGALIATRRMLRDARTEPQYGERVPYVVIAGGPGARLWERCVEPESLIGDENAELDAEYYINKNIIPPLERIFNLVGANVRQWYDEMPKVQRIRMLGGTTNGNHHNRDGDKKGTARKTMESYMGSSMCLVCRAKLPPSNRQPQQQLPLCVTCRETRTPATLLALRRKMQKAEAVVRDVEAVCRNCAGLAPIETVLCDSRDCPVFYSRSKAQTRLRVVERGVGEVLEKLEEEVVERESGLEW